MAIPDIRARLTTGAPNLYCQGPASALIPHNGIMFPIQPDISYSQSVNYSPYNLTHTNNTFNSYSGTPSAQIQVTAQFVQTTEEEVQYLQGVLHFLRSVTKMYYGTGDTSQNPRAGTPPPVLRFSALGKNQFNNIPVVVGNFATTYDSGVDLVPAGADTVPVVQTISIDLLQQHSPARQKYNFSKHAFLSGALYGDGFI